MSVTDTSTTNGPIAIIGLGRIGEALHVSLRNKGGVVVGVWDTDQTKVSHEQQLCNIIGASHVIFLCIPSSEVEKCVQNLTPDLLPGSIIVSLIKGLDPASQRTMHELLRELLPAGVRYAVLGGPMLSAEIAQGLPARGIIGAPRDVYEQLVTLTRGTALSFAHTIDAQGVAVAGVLKNVYALGLGIADALALGDNARGWLVEHAVEEMAILVEKLGGTQATAYGLAGLGDLIATGTSQHSKNRTAGRELVEHGHITLQSEGFISLPLLLQRVPDVAEFSLLALIARLVLQHHPAEEGFKEFFAHAARSRHAAD